MPHDSSRGAARTAGRKRADAERSVAAIVTAATGCFARDRDASMSDIAKAAGVSRVTLYAHFSSREELLRRVLAESVAEGSADIAATSPAEGPPAQAFAHLIRSAWPILSRSGSLHAAAQHVLPAEEVREFHDEPMAAVRLLIARGQADGSFRGDLPLEWVVTTVYSLLHAAVDEVADGRFLPDEAGAILEKTLLAVLRPG